MIKVLFRSNSVIAHYEPNGFCLQPGEGNEQLLAQLGCTRPAMQRRPLQQVLVKHQYRGSNLCPLHGQQPLAQINHLQSSN